jgi:hypothetical protein
MNGKINRWAEAQLNSWADEQLKNLEYVQMKFEHLAGENINSRTDDQMRDVQTYRRFEQFFRWAENIWTYYISRFTFINKGADEQVNS